jgi:hypothetical protein
MTTEPTKAERAQRRAPRSKQADGEMQVPPAGDRAGTNETRAPRVTKLDLVIAQLQRADGATLEELMAATGWQPHSVRGALAGALRKRGHAVISSKVDGVRRYRIGEAS